MSLASTAAAQEIIVDDDAPTEDPEPALFHIPYAFYSATWELAFGYGAIATGQIQDQLSLYINAIASTNKTTELQVGAFGAQIPGTERLFADTFLSLGNYTQLRAYIGEDGQGIRSGSNESGQDNFVQDTAVQIWSEARLRFILPIGPGRKEPIQTYKLHRGILVGPGTGGDVWNPLTSGRTSLGLRPFYRRQEFDLAEEGGKLATNGLAFSLEYDNRDFPRNPSRGSRQIVTFWQDFGALDSSASWSSVEFQASKYIDLGATNWARQQVVALGAWTADSPSWGDDQDGDGDPDNAPPYFMGATLGGRKRLRAYPTNRFNDRSGVHYWAEYRMIPGWQPLPDVHELDAARIDWWQIVFFAELGRVAPAWSFEQLHEEMKWDVGASIRIFARKALVRFDLAVGPEEWAALVDLSQPF